MRQQSFFFLGISASLSTILALSACGSVVQGGGSGGSGGSGSATASSSSSGAASSSSSSSVASSSSSSSVASSSSSTGSSSGGCILTGPLTGACTPNAACAGSASTCLAHVDQSASTTLNFRVADIKFTAPKAFTQGIVSQVFQGNALPNDPACNLNGSATFSWLLRFDTTAGTLKTGGAKPIASAAQPYTFDDEMVTQGSKTFHIAPVTLSAPVNACAFSSTSGDVLLPIFLDAMGTQSVLMPLRSLSFQSGTMSSDHDCIGRYNSAGLDPANSCLPDSLTPAFIPGAALSAFMSLEESDTIIISPLQESLCVLLSGNAAMYGDGGQPGHCKRDASGKIIFQGDWCAATNQAATPTCADAVHVAATFAAQAVQIQ